jgi:hypothetical protein
VVARLHELAITGDMAAGVDSSATAVGSTRLFLDFQGAAHYLSSLL